MKIATGGLIVKAKEKLEVHQDKSNPQAVAIEELAREEKTHSYEAVRLAVQLAMNTFA